MNHAIKNRMNEMRAGVSIGARAPTPRATLIRERDRAARVEAKVSGLSGNDKQTRNRGASPIHSICPSS